MAFSEEPAPSYFQRDHVEDDMRSGWAGFKTCGNSFESWVF